MRALGDGAIGLSHGDVDVTDGVGVSRIIRQHEPDWVINTAAFHRVDDCELNPSLAFAVNAVGASNVARAAADRVRCRLLLDRLRLRRRRTPRHDPHVESSLPDPYDVYGVSKVAGERMVMNANPKHLVIRSAGLYGTTTSRKGSTFPELMVSKGRNDGWARVVTDQVLSPTYTHDLADTTKALMERDATGLFHLANGGECSWFEFAQATFDIAGIAVNLEPSATIPGERRARRPPYSAMESERLAATGVPPYGRGESVGALSERQRARRSPLAIRCQLNTGWLLRLGSRVRENSRGQTTGDSRCQGDSLRAVSRSSRRTSASSTASVISRRARPPVYAWRPLSQANESYSPCRHRPRSPLSMESVYGQARPHHPRPHGRRRARHSQRVAHYGKAIAYDMPVRGDENYADWIWVPPGFAHGNTFPIDTVIEYLCSGEYSPGCEAGISPVANDIDWSLCELELLDQFQSISRNTSLMTDKDRYGLSMAAWTDDERSQNFLYDELH